MTITQTLLEARRVLGSNLRALMEHHDMRQQRVADVTHIAQPTVGRIINAENAATLDKIEVLATAFGLKAWQILVPGLDPVNPPHFLSERSSKRDIEAEIQRLVRLLASK